MHDIRPVRPALAAAMLCAACAHAPADRPAGPVPAAFAHPSPQPAAWPGAEWYRGFASGELSAFIEAAARDSLDISAARARLAQADARARQAGASILPRVDAQGNVNYLAGHSAASGSGHETDWAALLSASYEIDFWSRNRALRDAAGHALAASRAARDTVALTTLAGVADGYFEVLALRERLAIAGSNLDAARRVLAVVEARAAAGSASPLELATQRAALAEAETLLPALEQQRVEAEASLALLLGRAPEDFDIRARSLDGLQEPVVGAGLPSELLVRRPDVAAAEADLQAAQANVAAAHAALFPAISLTAQAGVQNPALNAAILSLPGSGATVNLGGSLLQTVFDHGRLRAAQAEAAARHEELLAAYRAAILDALRDAETALAALQNLDRQQAFERDSVAQSQRAFDGARLRYEAGSGDFLVLLDAQRTLYAARDRFVRYRLARLQALVSLCKALGGGWQEPTP